MSGNISRGSEVSRRLGAIHYTVEAENSQDAIERVLAGEGDKGDEDYPEPDIFVKSLEG